MRFIIRTIIALALVWIGLLLTGYGVLVGSTENAAGLGIQCKYLTAQGMSTAQYLHTDPLIGLLEMRFHRLEHLRVRAGGCKDALLEVILADLNLHCCHCLKLLMSVGPYSCLVS